MITIELTALENEALQMAGTASDAEVEGMIRLHLMLKGAADADEMAKQLAEAALSARRKIADATRYEIKVIGV